MSEVGPTPSPKGDGSAANLRAFLQKLSKRRKTITCSSKCRKAIEKTLKKFGGKSLEQTGRIKLDDLKEMLREPPVGVPPQTLREFVDIATAYDVGDGTIDLRELLKFAFENEPGILQRMSWMLPLLVLLVWLLLGPAVFCPIEGWSYLDGLYFSVLSLTTVGTNGALASGSEGSEIYPTAEAAKIFLPIYVLIGAGFTIWFLLGLSLAMLWPYNHRPLSLSTSIDLLAEDGHGTSKGVPLEDLVRDHPARLPPKRDTSEHGISDVEKGPHGPLRESVKPKSILQIHKESLREWAKPRIKTLQAVAFWSSILLEILLVLAAGVIIVLTTSSKASFLDAFSWAVLISLTVGYGKDTLGDGVNQNLARGLQMAFCLFSVFCILHMTFKIGRRYLRQRAEGFENRMKERILPADLLVDLDKTGAGVNRLEFLCASLLTSDRVSGHDLSLALEMFQRLDPKGSGVLHKSQLEAFQRATSSSHPMTLGELLESPQLHSQLEAMQFPERKTMDERTAAVLQEVYKDYDAVRRSLDAKDDELMQVLKEHGISEQARAQAVAQREAMRKEVALLSQAKTDLLQKLEKETKQGKESLTSLEELKSQNRSLEQKIKRLQLEHDEANNRLTTVTRQLKEVQHLNHEYQRRSQEAEREIQDFPRRLQEQAERLQHEADIRVHQVRVEAAEQNLERQGEMESAQLELKALSSSMEAMRGQLKSCSPRSPEVTTAWPVRSTSPLQWDVWSRPGWSSDPDGHGRLSEGKVRQQLDFLETQVMKQGDQHSFSTTLM